MMMTVEDAVRLSRETELVPDDSFKKHFLRAIRRDTDSRRLTFRQQTVSGLERRVIA